LILTTIGTTMHMNNMIKFQIQAVPVACI
jgi:hypothetical protein